MPDLEDWPLTVISGRAQFGALEGFVATVECGRWPSHYQDAVPRQEESKQTLLTIKCLSTQPTTV